MDLDGEGWILNKIVTQEAKERYPTAPDVVNVSVMVPGGVHTDLMAAGIIGDPYVGYRELEYR